MKFRYSKLVSTALISAGLAQIAAADIVRGQVTDASGEAPLAGAIVRIEGLNRSTTTDRYGDYRFANIPAGEHTVTVSYIGAAPVSETVNVQNETELDMRVGSDVRYLDNVLVVGSAAAQAGAINQQRAADAIINVIDSDGLGNFPDTTVADSLARVPGLSIETDQGEGRYVSIRGINTDLIAASINGVRTPSPEDRRGVLLDGVPSDLLDGITVQKSLTPDVDADSLGGVIDLKTISAFDRDGRFIRAKIEGAYNEISEDLSPKATLTYSDVFNDRLGVALSVNYQDLAIEAHNNETGEWGFLDDGTAFLNDDYEQRWYDLNRERIGFIANFDWRVSDNTELYLRTLYNNYEDDEVRNKFEFRDLDDAEDDGVVTADTQTVPLNEMDAEVRQRREIRQIQTYALGGQSYWQEWNFDYEVSYAYAEEDDSDNHDVTFRFEDIQDAAADAGLSDSDVLIDFSNPKKPKFSGPLLDLVYDPSNYFLDAFEEENTVNEDTETSARFDISRDSLIGDTPVEWKAGMKLRDREKTRDANVTFHEADDFNLSPFVDKQLVSGWRLANPMPAWPDPDLTRALRNGAGEGFELDEDSTNFDSLAEDFTIDEQILAAYAMGTFDLGNLTLIAGVRMEDTKTDLSGNIFAEEDDPANVERRDVSNDYTHWLPSVNAKYAFNDKLVARGAYYAAIVRPSFGQMAPFTAFNDDRDELELGNPGLDPYEADNFDLSLEYYPTELSVLSVGIFYKEIDNGIFPATFTRDETDAGDLVPLSDFIASVPVDLSYLTLDQLADVEEVNSFINVGSSEISGIEFNYVQSLEDLNEMLDGFLVSANLTLTDSDSTLPDGREVPFLKQSETIWNFAIGYDKGPWDLRVSANYRGDYVDELFEEDLDRYTDDRLLVEASAKYSVNDHFQLYLEGKNLTDEPEYYYFGSERRLSQYDEFGTTVVFGARLTY
ncbi:MAG: TonB-dependent receptor [Henriciella sp.]|jgi:TonB-dependent receptor|uniref:TonB-dependent receptor n=1 Tax=Henriciella sp. TaxID=1968823 RepID=UPI000C0FD57D|nr:TonB-dependent receptor [Henriciella sp.]MAN72458.1 TonB-dependent receptor [Henriciella sp.]MBF32984.1 TonB-dependent receptor [Hyphomonadaceae bacterium]PHR77866.1 MAG: TonB-dependent receptor [Henriciella sp.]|tara:strand:- start:1000 stop:3846 length:2847 start_codon:yes stop_codon:yes gene_type:complete